MKSLINTEGARCAEAAGAAGGSWARPHPRPWASFGPQQAVLIGSRLPGEAVFPDALIAFVTFQHDLQESA